MANYWDKNMATEKWLNYRQHLDRARCVAAEVWPGLQPVGENLTIQFDSDSIQNQTSIQKLIDNNKIRGIIFTLPTRCAKPY